MGKIKKLIQEVNSPKKAEQLLNVCLLQMAEFLNTSNIHASIDHSGYWISGTFYSNTDMVQEFINNFGDKKVKVEKPKSIIVTKPDKSNSIKSGRGRPKKST